MARGVQITARHPGLGDLGSQKPADQVLKERAAKPSDLSKIDSERPELLAHGATPPSQPKPTSCQSHRCGSRRRHPVATVPRRPLLGMSGHAAMHVDPLGRAPG
jgi:hypothetical protein